MTYYRIPQVGDSRGDFACPPDKLTIDEIVCELEAVGLDPEVDDDLIRVNDMVIYTGAHGWTYRVTRRYSQEGGEVQSLADLRSLAANITSNPLTQQRRNYHAECC